MKTRFPSILIPALALAAAAARAADVGLPPPAGRPHSVEVYYEHFSRNISQDFVSGTGVGDQEEGRYLARYARRVSPRLMLQATAGMADSDTAENHAPLLGLGARLHALRSSVLDLDVFAAGAYVHGIRYESAGSVERDADGHVLAEIPAVEQTESYFEFMGGLAVSRSVKLGEKLSCTPYGGIMVSKIDGHEEYDLTFPGDGRTETVEGDLRESGLASLFAGLALTFNEAWSLRLEGRLLNQASFSAGVSRSF